MKSVITIAFLLFLSYTGTVAAQPSSKMEALAKNPTTADMAAKADVYILGKSISNDVATDVQQPKPTLIIKKKKKVFKKK